MLNKEVCADQSNHIIPNLEPNPLDKLKIISISIKKRFLKMYFNANAGHVGSSLSCADILTICKFHWSKSINDEIILSKGHAAAALYATLAESGELSEEQIDTFYKDGTNLAAHPPANKLAKIPFATGSLGHGLSLATGLALSDKFTGMARNIFCITSDGELNEGSTWEASLFAAQHKLTNLYWLIDSNKIQGFGRTSDTLELEPLKLKIECFGWNVLEANGHNFVDLENAMNAVRQLAPGKPNAIICNTIKGKDMYQLQDEIACHYLPMSQNCYTKTLENILA
ncbi:1-deoxy-D-xylulose-5-phosphate synthase N-terminal domain-containing protein [Fluviispira sanaruensis]|uniref:Transketolase n=1 Tax=Fluviispira sanaruensis TaxID=2493639 RepID=A0A4P2VXW2_FLUSA|nr:1-deoxy-D-xylulose-5-phosphate synthase N-terminal domain-containing protein [Fluviispira sanaruensis]BBH53882.1 transketolase [Fluviispira sanaruensis]